MKEYGVKKISNKSGSKDPVAKPLTLEEYKRYILWFRENMLEGVEPAQVNETVKEKDSLKRDMS